MDGSRNVKALAMSTDHIRMNECREDGMQTTSVELQEW